MLWVVFMELLKYNFIGIGRFLHTCWDILQHFYGNHIVLFSDSSSAGCAICDIILVIWFFYNAANIYSYFQKYKTAKV